MTREQEYEIPDGSLYYEKQTISGGECGICITRLQGLAGEVEIPEYIEDCPVRSIGRKAFLSKKSLRRVTVPASVTEVGDWAFAYCDSLHTVVFCAAEEEHREEKGRKAEECKESPGRRDTEGGDITGVDSRELRFGKSVFMDCGSLRFLYVRDGRESTAALLAAAVTTAGVPYLLQFSEAGSREWLEKWDARMMTVLHSADNEGYSRQVLCGEEDYGSTDLPAYESGQRKIKVRLLLLRLLYPEGLSAHCRQELEEYLREHTKGCAHEETWEVVLSEHGEDRAYCQLFAELGCVSEDNFDTLLADVGGEYPELKAYLMRYKEERLGYTDFFAGLDL